jgi:hypothetical protein
MAPQTTKKCQKSPIYRNTPIIPLSRVIFLITKIIKIKFENQRKTIYIYIGLAGHPHFGQGGWFGHPQGVATPDRLVWG